jgi:8-oxo-dGTP diphosphatase
MNQPFHHLTRGIFLKDRRVLLARAKGHRNTFLPGGHIEFGESAKDALKREVLEELGLTCEIGKFIGVVEHTWLKKGILNCELNQLFEASSYDLNSTQPLTSNEPHLEFIWCDIDALDAYNLQPYPLRNIIKRYSNGTKDAVWASSLNEDIDEFNTN